MSNVKIEFVLAGRKIELSMAIDPDSKTDQALLYALRVGGCPEPEVADLMARVLRPGDNAIDGGANIGFFSSLMSKLVGPTGRVLAFEPGENNIFKFRENTALNKCDNVALDTDPLWDKSDEIVELYMCLDGSKNSLAAHPDTRGSAKLQTTCLDNYHGLLPTRLIKLDIEGVEEKALRGGSKFLIRGGSKFLNSEDGCPYIVMELNLEALPKFQSSPDRVRDLMREHGYSMFILHFNGALPTYVPRHTKVTPNRLNWNVLFSTFEAVGHAWPEIKV